MAERFFGIDRGDEQIPASVTEGSSTTATTDVEVRVDMAGFSGTGYREEVVRLLDVIKMRVLQSEWPPA